MEKITSIEDSNSRHYLKFKRKRRYRKSKNLNNKDNKKKLSPKTENDDDINDEKDYDYEIIKKNFRNFFHVNWDDRIYNREYSHVTEALSPLVYWYLINNSYFVEQNISDNINKINEIIGDNNNISNSKYNFSNNRIDNIIYNYEFYDKNKLYEEIWSIYKNFVMNAENQDYYLRKNKNINKLDLIKTEITNAIKKLNKINKDNLTKLRKYSGDLIVNFHKNNNYVTNLSKNEHIIKNPLYESNENSYQKFNLLLSYMKYKEKENGEITKNEKTEKNINNKTVLSSNNNINNSQIEQNKSINCRKCSICNNGDLIYSGLLLDCEKCGLVVHSNCYGIQYLTKNIGFSWKCDACKEMDIEKVKNLECILCPIKGGAMKKLDMPKNCNFCKKLYEIRNGVNFDKEELMKSNLSVIIPKISYKKIDCVWAHLSCILWNPYLSARNYNLMQGIKLINKLNLNCYCGFCNICNKYNYGPTVKCKEKNCELKFHPECARINNYCMEIDKIGRNYKYSIYCSNHRQFIFAKKINKYIKAEIQEIAEFSNELQKIYDISEKKEEEFPSPFKKKKLKIIPLKKIKKIKKLNNIIIPISQKIEKIGNNNFITSNRAEQITITKSALYNPNLDNINKIKTNNYNICGNSSSSLISNHSHLNSFKTPVTLVNTEYKSTLTINNNIKNLYVQVDNYENLDEDNSSNSSFSLIEEIDMDKNQEFFSTFLIGYLNDYLNLNRIVISKRENGYKFDEMAPIYYLKYNDFFNGTINLREITYENISFEKKFKEIFPDKETFKKLFIHRIKNVLSALKKNEKYKDVNIVCRNEQNCFGKEGGVYKLLEIKEFRYQKLNDKIVNNCRQNFICPSCKD